jgi:hypothetical protein
MTEPDLSRVSWRKSSYSGGGNDCVEVAFIDGVVAVRDSKDPDGGAFAFSSLGWNGLLDALRAEGRAHR